MDGFANAVLFSLTARGIPFFYYGGEFGYKGGKDPANRETFWTDIEGYLKKDGSFPAKMTDLKRGYNPTTFDKMNYLIHEVNYYRKFYQIYDAPMEEKLVTDNFYAYQRGETVTILTNTDNKHEVQVTVENLDFPDGT